MVFLMLQNLALNVHSNLKRMEESWRHEDMFRNYIVILYFNIKKLNSKTWISKEHNESLVLKLSTLLFCVVFRNSENQTERFFCCSFLAHTRHIFSKTRRQDNSQFLISYKFIQKQPKYLELVLTPTTINEENWECRGSLAKVHHGGKFQELSSTGVSRLTYGECHKCPEVVEVRKHHFLNVQETL